MSSKSYVSFGEILGSISRGAMGHGAFPPTERWKKLTLLESFIEIARPFLVIMAIPTVGIGAFLSPGTLPSPLILAAGILACIFAVSGTHAFNDWTDRERDKTVWPNRPIPAGRFPTTLALVFALFLMGLAVGVTWIFYNPTATAVIATAEILAILYCLFLRDHVGYLSLPFIIALLPIGGWAAVSPETLFSSILPWLLGGIVLTWQAGHIMVYAPAHPIRDENGILRCEKKALFFFPTPKQAAVLGFFFVALLFVESLALMLVAGLGIFYWSLALPAGILTVGTALWLLFAPTEQRRAIFTFNAASTFLTFLCGGAVLDVIFRKHLGTFLAWGISTAKKLLTIVEQGSSTIENAIYAAGLAVTIAVVLFFAVGILKGIMKSGEASEPE